MATFIPEWVRVSGREAHIKRVLNALKGDYIIRRPIRPDTDAPDIFVQHLTNGWLALAVCDAVFAALDPGQLFVSDARIAFERQLDALQQLETTEGAAAGGLPKLLLLWSCTTEEARTLAATCGRPLATRLVSRDEFAQSGVDLIHELLSPLPAVVEHTLLGRFFPEAEIPAACTTRRDFHRDNSARLARYFLDPEQECASKLDLDMPQEQAGMAKDFSVRLVNGVAGSGKTLIALNRGLMLASMFPSQRLLFLIHNTPIVADIKERLHRARGGLPGNLEISTFFGWLHQQWRNVFEPVLRLPPNAQVVPELIKRCRARWPELKQADELLLQEMDFINEHLISDEAGYLDANRVGRGFSLRPQERSMVWALYACVSEQLRLSNLRMWSAVPRDISLAEDHSRLRKYHHVLIDEAQFCAPSWFQVVKLSTAAEGQLFLCADPNQGFMKNRLSWKSVGLDVAGRTKKLRKSYRTTRLILEAANSVLQQAAQGDPDDYLEPDFTGMETGERPMLIYTDSPQDAVDRLVNELAAITAPGRVPFSALLVIFGDKVPRYALHKQLGNRFGSETIWCFNEKDQKKLPPRGYGQDYLRTAYVDTATGLEGSVVFLVGVEELFSGGAVPGIGEEERLQRREELARKLYMAMTRAGQRLCLISSRPLPGAIEQLFDVVGR